jgi:hypothetical protein
MAQLVDCLPSQCKALSSNSSTAKKKKRYLLQPIYYSPHPSLILSYSPVHFVCSSHLGTINENSVDL